MGLVDSLVEVVDILSPKNYKVQKKFKNAKKIVLGGRWCRLSHKHNF